MIAFRKIQDACVSKSTLTPRTNVVEGFKYHFSDLPFKSFSYVFVSLLNKHWRFLEQTQPFFLLARKTYPKWKGLNNFCFKEETTLRNKPKRKQKRLVWKLCFYQRSLRSFFCGCYFWIKPKRKQKTYNFRVVFDDNIIMVLRKFWRKII